MEHEIKEEGILEVKALTVTRGVFKQMVEVPQKVYQEYVDHEGRDPWDVAGWVGYVVDGESQIVWFILQKDGTLKRVRDMELWWVMRNQDHLQPTDELRRLLRQVFLK
jgi:hypothetical protein